MKWYKKHVACDTLFALRSSRKKNFVSVSVDAEKNSTVVRKYFKKAIIFDNL